MLSSFRSAAVLGVEAYAVSVEVDVAFGLPQFSVVGLPDATVRESRDRVRSAIKNSGLEFPAHRITVNLGPADVRKAGTSFDLPIALGLLASSEQLRRRVITDTMVLGELSLDGGIHAVRGVLAVAVAARSFGVTRLVVPPRNAAEACAVEGLEVVMVSSLTEAVAALEYPTEVRLAARAPERAMPEPEEDFADVRGQAVARRAIEVAAAGGHNVLMTGPPGAGKTMLARRVASILPPLTFDESIECTKVHSVAGQLPSDVGLLRTRPFRAPHHTSSHVALIGGGAIAKPGEVSLAHHGVLFLDELPEFERRVLEALRQPLESGRVSIARASGHVEFPARFMLIAAMNPCECGYAGSERQPCHCTPTRVQRYGQRVSGPLRDRMDICLRVPPVPHAALAASAPGEPSAAVRSRVVAARALQADRMGTGGLNARLCGAAVARHCRPDHRGSSRLARAADALGISARGYHRILKVARTIADLDGAAAVADAHVAEAIQFRALDGRLALP